MDIDERIANLQAAMAHPTPLEAELLKADVLVIAPAATRNPGSSNPPLVMLETRREAFHKRFCDQDANLCRQYQQDRLQVPLNEVIAWRLAYTLGEPWRQLAPTAVLRKLEDKGGALINRRNGSPVLAGVIGQAQGQAMAAGFFDALIGNQDRNARNFRFDASASRLGLIDHGFAFARPGDRCNTSLFLAFRRTLPGSHTLVEREREAVDALLDSGDLHGLTRFLPWDRAAALEQRALRMQQSRCLPMPGAF